MTPSTILSIVSTHFKVSEADILGYSRKRKVMLPRQMLCKLLRRNTDLQITEIGEMIHREREIVHRNIGIVNDLMEVYPQISHDYYTIQRAIDKERKRLIDESRSRSKEVVNEFITKNLKPREIIELHPTTIKEFHLKNAA